MNSDDSLETKGGVRRWWAVMLLVVVAAVCMVLFFFPAKPGYLVSLSTTASRFENTVKKDVFPGSQLLLGMAYGCMSMYDVQAEFYADFAVPQVWPKEQYDSVRVWISRDDYDRVMDDSEVGRVRQVRVRVYEVDVLDRRGRWSHYVAAHPHGGGGWFMTGALAGILAMVLFVKRLFYES